MNPPVRCIDLTPAQVVRALRKKEAMGALLNHMADIAKAGEGAPKILVPIARIATSDCAWFEGGDLRVTIAGTDEVTRILLEVDRGSGREKLFPKLLLTVPFEEFARAVKMAPKLIHPMKGKETKDGLLLTCEDEVVGTAEPMPFRVAEAAIRKSIPAPLRRSLPPLAKADDAPPSVRVDMPAFDEAALLKSGALKRAPLPKLDEEPVDAGWDDEAATTPKGLRASKPPPRASKAPPRASKAPPRASKAPPRASKAPAARTDAKVPAPAAPGFRAPPRPAPAAVPRPAPRRSIPPKR